MILSLESRTNTASRERFRRSACCLNSKGNAGTAVGRSGIFEVTPWPAGRTVGACPGGLLVSMLIKSGTRQRPGEKAPAIKRRLHSRQGQGQNDDINVGGMSIQRLAMHKTPELDHVLQRYYRTFKPSTDRKLTRLTFPKLRSSP